MLRITPIPVERPASTLRLEGKLVGPWVDELAQVCTQLEKSATLLQLDLSGVRFADAAGVHLLRCLRDQGVVLTACSALLTELLQAEGRG